MLKGSRLIGAGGGIAATGAAGAAATDDSAFTLDGPAETPVAAVADVGFSCDPLGASEVCGVLSVADGGLASVEAPVPDTGALAPDAGAFVPGAGACCAETTPPARNIAAGPATLISFCKWFITIAFRTREESSMGGCLITFNKD